MTAFISSNNPKIRQLRALRQQKHRHTTGLFVVEGIHHVGEAVAASSVEYICYAPDLLSSEFARNLVQEQLQKGVACYPLKEETFTSLAEKENPQGILAVVHQKKTDLSQVTPENFSWGVALAEPQDPGNIGAVLRTIDAVGASGLLLLGNCADPYHTAAVRASMGAIFWVPVVQVSYDAFTGWARDYSYHLYGTSAHGSVTNSEVLKYNRPMILLMGSERQGLNPTLAAECKVMIRLPMRGRASSLNLAVAAGVMLYDMMAKLSSDSETNR